MSTNATSANALAVGNWELDPSRSSVEFHVRHFYGLLTVKGHFDRYEGRLDLSGSPAVSLEIEAASLFERVDNALKLIGDHYLSRVFELASSRFHLRGWQQSIRRKLETVGDVYDLLIQQAGGHRMEALEVTVVILIALEIALALWRH